jgi:outer membrane protein
MRIICMLPLLLLLLCSGARADALSLHDCLHLARVHNPTLKSASHDPVIAKEIITQAKSGHLPRVDVAGGYTAMLDAQAFKTPAGSSPTGEADYGFFNLTIDQTLYDFGRTSSRVNQAKALQEASRFRYRSLEQDIFLQTVAAYYRILETQKLVRSAQKEVAQMKDHLAVAKNLYDQGVVTQNDVLQAQVQLADSNQRLLARRNQLENAWLELNYVTGRPPKARGTLEEVSEIQRPAPGPAPRQAVAERPELKAARKVVEASEEAVKESKDSFRPELFLQAGADYEQNKYVTQQTLYSATVGVRFNLFEGYTTTSRLRQAVEESTRQQDRLRDLTEQAGLEYRTARNDADVAARRIAVAQKAIAQAEENLRINKNRYLEQVGTATDVIDAQTLLTRTRTEYDQAVFDYEVALARIKRATGKL